MFHFPDTGVRFPTAADAENIAGIHVDAWRAAYEGIVPAAQLAALSKTQRADEWRRGIAADPRGILLVEKDALVHGWIAFGRCRDEANPAEGEIYALYVGPDHWRRGLGRQLMVAAEDELGSRGVTRVTLWVLERNEPARAFYERSGYRSDGSRKEISFGETTLTELRYEKTLRRDESRGGAGG